jgi:exopolysaccharide biosynthesis WecB/TagA/CpsF family protein
MEFRIGGGERVRVNLAGPVEALAAVETRLAAGRGFALATLNLDHLVKLETDAGFRAAYARHDYVTADGNPVVWLSRLGRAPVGLCPGADLVLPLARLAARRGAPMALVGSTERALARAAARLAAEAPGVELRALVAPPMGFDPDGEAAAAILARLGDDGVRLVLVALGAPKQERFAALGRRLAPSLGFVGVGAGLDFLAGEQRRAPPWMRRLALEWLWRAATSPRRLAGRYARGALALPGLAWRVWRGS